MIISDLSYLNEIAEESINGGTNRQRYRLDVDKNIKVDFDIKVDQNINARGSFNELSFDLYADGYHGSGTEVVVEQTAVDDYWGSLSAQKGTVSSYAN